MTALVPAWVPDALAWVVIGTFLVGWLLEDRRRELARLVASAGWATFGVFWLSLFPQFAFEMKSFIEGALSLAAVPACLYAGYLLYSGRDSLFVLSRAVAVMGIIYLPFETVFVLRKFLVELVTHQVEWTIYLLGYRPEVTTSVPPGITEKFMILSAPGNDFSIRNTFIFTDATGSRFRTFIVLACTGIGSMSIFGGLIAAVRAPLDRKLTAFAVAIPIIWVLNVARNVFIATAFGNQWFQFFVDPIMNLVGYTQPGMVSFFLADRVISQGLSVVALVAITWLVVRIVPELLVMVEDALFIATGNEYDLESTFSATTAKTDGGR